MPLSLGALLLAGCGGAGTGLPEEGSEGPGGKADTGDGTSGTAGLPTVVGHYAFSMESVVEAVEVDTGETRSERLAAVGLVEAYQDGNVVHLLLHPCRATVPDPVVIRDRVLQNAPVIGAVGYLLPGELGTELVTDPAAALFGVELENPLTDPLPESKSDPRVVDHDGDGRPGVTLEAQGFNVYVGIRATFVLSGIVDEHGAATGSFDISADVQVYGDNIPFISAAKRLPGYLEAYDVNTVDPTFRLVPLGEQTIPPTCDDVLAMGLVE